MNYSLITRRQLEIINRKTLRYPLQVAEKDYFLAVVMQIISSSQWGNSLIFKGGTALNHCYLPQQRFSEDLDFSTNQKNIALEDLREVFSSIPFLAIKKEYQSDMSLKIEKLQYTGPLVLPNSLKVEVDFYQNVLLPPLSKKYHNVWGLEFNVQVMDIKEISAEKIRAMSDRARYRDFYDLYSILDQHTINLDEVTSYIQRKEIRIPIKKANILNNWQIVSAQKAIEMSQVYYSKKIDDDQIRAMIDGLPFSTIS